MLDCNRLFIAIPLIGIILLSGCAGPDRQPVTQPITITLLHTNDTHSRLEPFPRDGELSASDPGPQQGGLARRKTLIDRVHDREPHVLLLDAGDYFQGTIFYNAWKGSADIMGLNALGYDAATLGNHEFDLGPAELGRALRGEPVTIAGESHATEKPRLPIIATNVDVSGEPALNGLLRASVIVERGGERFGILGVVTADIATISSPGPNVRVLDYVDSVRAEAGRLREQGVNKIILLSHYGYTVDVEQVPRLSDVDIIFSGHDHALLGDPAAVEAVAPGQGVRVKGPYPTVVRDRDGAPVLVVSAYEWGRWLGRLKVGFDESGVARIWQGTPIFVRGCEFAGGAVDCSQEVAPEDLAVKAKVAAYRQPVDRFANAVIGQSGIAFDGNRDPGVRTREMPIGNLVADAMLAAAAQSDRAVVAIINGGAIRASLDQGKVTFAEALAVLPFNNTMVALDLRGAELVAALDHGLSEPGEGAFPQVAGLKLTYCAGASCAGALRPQGRVTGLAVNGRPVDLNATYRIAINSFMAGGGDGYAMLKEACARPGGYCRDTGILDLDLLARVFARESPVVRQVEGRIVAR